MLGIVEKEMDHIDCHAENNTAYEPYTLVFGTVHVAIAIWALVGTLGVVAQSGEL